MSTPTIQEIGKVLELLSPYIELTEQAIKISDEITEQGKQYIEQSQHYTELTEQAIQVHQDFIQKVAIFDTISNNDKKESEFCEKACTESKQYIEDHKKQLKAVAKSIIRFRKIIKHNKKEAKKFKKYKRLYT